MFLSIVFSALPEAPHDPVTHTNRSGQLFFRKTASAAPLPPPRQRQQKQQPQLLLLPLTLILSIVLIAA